MRRAEAVRIAVDVEITDATDKLLLGLDTAWFARVRVTSDEERIVGVGRRHSGNSDSGLHKDVVYRQGDDVLGFDG